MKKFWRFIMENAKRIISAIFGLAGLLEALSPYEDSPRHRHSDTAFQPIRKGIRNPKDPTKKAAIIRRRKAQKLSELSKSKRRAVYYYNLRHPVKMYGVTA